MAARSLLSAPVLSAPNVWCVHPLPAAYAGRDASNQLHGGAGAVAKAPPPSSKRPPWRLPRRQVRRPPRGRRGRGHTIGQRLTRLWGRQLTVAGARSRATGGGVAQCLPTFSPAGPRRGGRHAPAPALNCEPHLAAVGGHAGGAGRSRQPRRGGGGSGTAAPSAAAGRRPERAASGGPKAGGDAASPPPQATACGRGGAPPSARPP